MHLPFPWASSPHGKGCGRYEHEHNDRRSQPPRRWRRHATACHSRLSRHERPSVRLVSIRRRWDSATCWCTTWTGDGRDRRSVRRPYQLATRILLRGIQRRPRMTAQGHNRDVRPRKLSPVSSFRADRECGSSGPSTLTLRALSGRSLRAFRAASWALLAHLLSSHRASEQTKRWEVMPALCARVVLVWLGWGRAPKGGGTTAAPRCSSVPPAGVPLRPCTPCARTPTRY